jgi:hypothetical protein
MTTDELLAALERTRWHFHRAGQPQFDPRTSELVTDELTAGYFTLARELRATLLAIVRSAVEAGLLDVIEGAALLSEVDCPPVRRQVASVVAPMMSGATTLVLRPA